MWVMNMSNNWKKRVSDFFFEEIEVEMEEEIKEQSGNPVYRTHPTYRKPVDTKVTYQYPKKDGASFRFPVIPDDVEAQDTDATSPIAPRNLNRSRKTKRPRKVQNSLKVGYEQKKAEKELENVPAYIRRQQEREEQRGSLPIEEPSQPQEESPRDKLEGYTRPDELDRVFRIRDGHTSANDQSMKQAEVEGKKRTSLHDAIKRKEKLTALKQKAQLEEAAIPQQAETLEEQEEDNFPLKTVLNVYNETIYEEPYQTEKTTVEPEENLIVEQDDIDESTIQKDPFIPVPNYLLNDPQVPDDGDREWLQQQEHLLNQTLEHFNIDATVVNVTQGPSVTRFEIQPALGVKVSRIRGLSDDIKLNMAAEDIRMEAPIPGKNTIGIEVPNQFPQVVTLQEIIEAEAFEQSDSDLTIALGLTIEGEPLITTIDKMPHGLIAGATGSGKSVCMNSIILSLLY